MTYTEPLLLTGVPGSPYTRKMLAYLRFRQIPYRFLMGHHTEWQGQPLPTPRVALLPTFYLPDAQGALQAVVDSTPLIRRFEHAYEGRRAVPFDPVLRLLHDLVEDYADEWLTKAMFHYRWHYAADIDKAAGILPLWQGLGQNARTLALAGRAFSERQISRLHVVGSNATTHALIEASYHRFLAALNSIIEAQTFVLGDSPSAADFALYGQLTQLAGFDPTPRDICLHEAPRVSAWVDFMEDLSGWEQTATWPAEYIPSAPLNALLSEIGRVYPPVMLANARAIAQGQHSFQAEVQGSLWAQPVFPYQAKCLLALRASYAELDRAQQSSLMAMLAGTGCDAVFTASADTAGAV